MVRITTYCIKPQFLDVLMQSLAGLSATITMRQDPDDVLKCLPGRKTDILFINDVPEGMKLLNSIRKFDPITPVVLINNNSEPRDPEESGNDLFIKCDVSVEYLFPKIHAMISSHCDSGKQLEIHFRNSIFNYPNRELVFEDRREQMSKKEAEILRMFYLNRNNILLKDDIVRLVWGRSDIAARNSFSVYLCNLKKIIRKEESIAIRTVRGHGYIFYMDHT